MANQKNETKDKSANSQKDAKAAKQPVKKSRATTASEAKSRGKCPPGQRWNPITEQCE